MKIFIGSLSYNVTEGDLRHAFEAFGQVTSTSVVKDQESDRSKGFGFVKMAEQAEAQSAISALNGQAFNDLLGAAGPAGRDEEARAEVAEVLRIHPKFSLEAAKRVPYKKQADTERIVNAVRKAGLK
jgi:hypothetical protein